MALELERERQERHEANEAVANFKRQLSLLHDKCTTYESDIDQLKAQLDNLNRGM
jgi:kinetochore protein Spc25, fungi type